MLKMAKLLKVILVVSMIFVISGCGKKNKAIYVGTNAEYPPFEYFEGEKIVGFDIDLMNEIAKLTGKEIEIKNLTFDGLLPALQSKNLDIVIAGMTATETRKKSVNFSDTYFVAEQSMLLKKDNNTIKAFEELPGYTVGVVLGYVGDTAVSKLSNVNIQRYNNTGETVMALKAGKIDAAVIDFAIAEGYVKQNDDLKVVSTDLPKQELAIAFRKEDEALLKEVNQALITLKENGTYDKLVAKYFN